MNINNSFLKTTLQMTLLVFCILWQLYP
jgi:hypothetical protein